MLLNNQWTTEEIKQEINIYLKISDSENMTIQEQWGAAKVVLRGKFISIDFYLKKQEKSQTNNLTLYLCQVETKKE